MAQEISSLQEYDLKNSSNYSNILTIKFAFKFLSFSLDHQTSSSVFFNLYLHKVIFLDLVRKTFPFLVHKSPGFDKDCE